MGNDGPDRGLFLTTTPKISGCTPEIARNLEYRDPYGPIITSAFKALADPHELASEDDVSIIGPIHPSGQHFEDGPVDGILTDTHPITRARNLHPEKDVRVMPRCVMGDSWEIGIVDGPPQNRNSQSYLISRGCTFLVQTYALDIMALVTAGRMTPLRIWRLALLHGFENVVRPWVIEGVEYGEVTGLWESDPEAFPGYTDAQLRALENLGNVETVKQRMIDEGRFWVWMAPDRFPIHPEIYDISACTLALVDADVCGGQSMIETLPHDVLIPIISYLPLPSLLQLASASQTMRTNILGNNYLACVWLYHNAPWWVPVRTHTPYDNSEGAPPVLPYLACQWMENTPITIPFPARLDWAYIKRCVRSGSMRNRKRIWRAAAEIEQVAVTSGI